MTSHNHFKYLVYSYTCLLVNFKTFLLLFLGLSQIFRKFAVIKTITVKQTAIISFFCSLCIILGSCTASVTKGDASSPTSDSTAVTKEEKVGKLVEAVQKCSRLYCVEYKMHKIVTHDDELKLKGSVLGIDYDIPIPAGSRSIAIPIEATIKCYIDFSDFSEANVEYDGDRLEITLPDPQVELTSTKINHDDVQEYVALLRSKFSDAELSGYEKEGRDLIIKQIPSLKLAERSRVSASRILLPLLEQLDLGAEDIVITFRQGFTEPVLTTPKQKD